MGKGEIAHNEQFLLFPQCFQLNQIIVYPFVHVSDVISLFASELEEPKVGISGKGLSTSPDVIMPLWIHEAYWSFDFQNMTESKKIG